MEDGRDRKEEMQIPEAAARLGSLVSGCFLRESRRPLKCPLGGFCRSELSLQKVCVRPTRARARRGVAVSWVVHFHLNQTMRFIGATFGVKMVVYNKASVITKVTWMEKFSCRTCWVPSLSMHTSPVTFISLLASDRSKAEQSGEMEREAPE